MSDDEEYLTEVEVEHLEFDFLTLQKYVNDVVDEDKSKPHLCWPVFNQSAFTLSNSVFNELQGLYDKGATVSEARDWLARSLYPVLLGTYLAGKNGYEVLNSPCARDHSLDEEDD